MEYWKVGFSFESSGLCHFANRICYQNNGISRACLSAFAAQNTFNRHVRMLLLKHHITGTYLDTYHTTRACIRIDDKDPILELDGIFRAVVGTFAALIANMDTVIARGRKACFNAQQ